MKHWCQHSKSVTERFGARQAGADLFWYILTFLVENQGNQVIPDADDLHKNAEKQRITGFLWTPPASSCNEPTSSCARAEAKKPFKITLKFRTPDRYTTACFDVHCKEKVDANAIKSEDDVAPLFISKFVYSVSFKAKTLPSLATVANPVVLFPGLKSYGIAAIAPVMVVNGFKTHEVLRDNHRAAPGG